MNKKLLTALALIVIALVVANLQVTRTPVRAALYTQTDATAGTEANQHVEFTINIKFRLRLPNLVGGAAQ